MADLVERVVNFTIKKANGVPAADLDVFFIPKETAPGDNFIGSDLTVSARTNASGVGTATLYTYENSFLNYYAEWEGSGGRLEFTLADEVGDADLGELLAEAAQSEDLRFRVASTTVLGAVKIDGTTITIDENGVISSTGGGGAGDMEAATYDPQNIADDAFDRANHTGEQAQSTITNLVSDLALKAPLASPTFTGTPAAPTAAPGTNTTQISTTEFVQAAIAALINSAPGALDTLDELANALGDDANFAATVTMALAGKQVSSSALTAIAGIAPSNDDIIQRKAGTWTNRTPAEFKTDLALSKSDVGLSNVPNTDATTRANHTGTQTASTISDFVAAVLATPLTGLGAGTNEPIADTDLILAAFAKLQNQISNFSGGGMAVGGAITSGTASRVLYEDASNNLGETANFTYTAASSQLKLIAASAAHIPLAIQGAASQTGDLVEFKNSGGTNLMRITKEGYIRFGTGATYPYILGDGAQINLFGSSSTYISVYSGGMDMQAGGGELRYNSNALTPKAAGGLDLGTLAWGWKNLFMTEFLEMTEMTAPSAPAANKARLYAEDNGAGKTRLMVLFPSGAAQQVAIEP